MGTCTVHSYNESREDEGSPRMGFETNETLTGNPDTLDDSDEEGFPDFAGRW